MIRVIISGGGTGGHIFPAISIANAIREKDPDAQILFVGAQGKMEMEKVPAAGYEIIGLPVAGFQRRFTLKNITFFFKLFASMLQANQIIKKFNPDVVVGVGGYASGPVLRAATRRQIPTLIQEQNSFPGVTNRILSKRVNAICVAYRGMEKFFPQRKIIYTGNPVRQLFTTQFSRSDAARFFNLDESKKTVLVIGGSLGARSVNRGILSGATTFISNDIQVIWQTGKIYYDEMKAGVSEEWNKYIRVYDFIQRMDYAYGLADLVISRAGASSISEIALLGKAALFVPSPNVAEDHQTKNALALVNAQAACMVPDADFHLIAPTAVELLNDDGRIHSMRSNVMQFAMPDASAQIAEEVFKLKGVKL